MQDVNATGEAFLSHTKLGDRYVLRLAVGNIRTERRHVARAWELLRHAAATNRGSPRSERHEDARAVW
jgi:aromatic-L-amino-acid decarboxylase